MKKLLVLLLSDVLAMFGSIINGVLSIVSTTIQYLGLIVNDVIAIFVAFAALLIGYDILGKAEELNKTVNKVDENDIETKAS